ncbi:hypothetical protein CEXT_11061, partial [Caerostris extrusa]
KYPTRERQEVCYQGVPGNDSLKDRHESSTRVDRKCLTREVSYQGTTRGRHSTRERFHGSLLPRKRISTRVPFSFV